MHRVTANVGIRFAPEVQQLMFIILFVMLRSNGRELTVACSLVIACEGLSKCCEMLSTFRQTPAAEHKIISATSWTLNNLNGHY